MRLFIELVEAKRGFNCCRCGGRTRTCEKFYRLMNYETGKQTERFCVHCKAVALDDLEYNGDTLVPDPSEEGEDEAFRNMQDAEMQREQYGAYVAAGCPKAYWDDQEILAQEREYIRRRGL